MEKEHEMDKNDHRVIGKELDLFTFSDLVGSGLPLWTPKGTVLREELDAFVQKLRQQYGYNRVTIPHITKRELYEISGHWDKFSDELFKIISREGKEYALKPMSCPHHTQIFNRKPHSYREMPQRYAETTMVYRDEQSGELGGLTRVLSITQDDAHVFCRNTQVKEEFLKIWDIVDKFYKTFGFSLKVRLSFRDLKEQKKYLGTKEIWDKAESELRNIAEDRGADYFEGPGEAALYGPKLDFMAKNSAGREWQVATIQLDMNLPERFDLTCVNEKGEKERIVMIHAAITGSLERCAAVLIEHYAGAFPLWLSPVQVKIIPVRTNHNEYAKQVFEMLGENNIRAELDDADENLGSKVRDAKTNKIPYWIVIGDKEIEANKVTLESRDSGQLGQISKEELITKLLEEIKNKK
jgi:threonyl-tRNA synthetase